MARFARPSVCSFVAGVDRRFTFGTTLQQPTADVIHFVTRKRSNSLGCKAV